jgi:3-mercaptopyruvate sulfurtransferase SseA
MALRNLHATIRHSAASGFPSTVFSHRIPSMARHYTATDQRPLTSAAELKASILSNSRPVVLDCTWFMPNVARDPIAEYQQSRIPGARFFNLDEVIDKSSPYPHMLPSAEDFAAAVGISNFVYN